MAVAEQAIGRKERKSGLNTVRFNQSEPIKSGFGLGLRQPDHAVAGLPLAAFLEQFHAFKTLEHVTFGAERAGTPETSML